MFARNFIRHCLWLAAALTTLPCFRPDASAQSTPPTNVVVIVAYEGKVEISRAGSPRWDPGQTNQVLDPGDQIRTGPRSRATLRLFDLTEVRVDENSTFEIERPPQEESIIVHILRGALYLFHRDEPGSVRFRSKSSAAATRGTELNVAVDEESGAMTLTMFEGAAELANAEGTLLLASGEQGVAEPGAPPRPTLVVHAVNVIQWCLYYPAVLEIDELALDGDARRELQESLAAYRAGDLLRALENYPDDREPATAAEAVYLAGLLFAVGQVDDAEARLRDLPAAGTAAQQRLVRALLRLADIVKGLEPEPNGDVEKESMQLATVWMVRSYARQSRAELEDALDAARRATLVAPDFGFAWTRVAELEFSFGRVDAAQTALSRALALSPRHAQAVALQGFLLAAKNRIVEAVGTFDHAIALDSALPDAWLGRGLCHFRLGREREGRSDLQTAVVLDPRRSLLRSYLGKAYGERGGSRLAFHELTLAKTMDPLDPTPWLYNALLAQEHNRVNDAVRDLERSIALNDNRRLYRSQMLLDQDRAVRGANLANIYLDAGMKDVSVREATRAVNADYANYSAHLFLANSFNELRDPNQVNLRYETAWFSEFLLANLLAPAGAGSLSQFVSQQEYSRLFEQDGLGFVSRTEYFSHGDWRQRATQHGQFGDTGYAVDLDYRSENGQRANNDQEQFEVSLQLKHQFSLKDGVFFQSLYYDAEGGDLNQYYDPDQANRGFRFEEEQEPLILAGYHREWNPHHHTLLLVSRLDDTFRFHNPTQPELLLFQSGGQTSLVPVPAFSSATNRYRNELEIYSAELQHIWQRDRHSIIAGGRFQAGALDTGVQRISNSAPFILIGTGGATNVVPPVPSSSQEVDNDFHRGSLYGYYSWQMFEPLQITAGLSYDRMRYPENFLSAPVSEDEDTTDQWSPKAGLTWQPDARTTLRGAYTRSLGGMSLDQSVRLEPTQVAGFNQAFRSIIPESVAGNVSAAEFEAWGVSAERRFHTGTYVGIEGGWLRSEADRVLGAVDLTSTFPPLEFQFAPGATRQRLDFEEQSLLVTFNQLIADAWAVGARYRLSRAELNSRFRDIPPAAVTGGNLPLSQDVEAVLHQGNLFALFHHPSGFFGRLDALWSHQSNHGYAPEIPGDDFWQFNVMAGYRFYRRHAEVRVGVLNLFDQDYRLNPLNLTAELPRERTFATSFSFYF